MLFNYFIVTISLKCLSEKGTVTRSELTIWDKNFIQKVYFLILCSFSIVM